MTYNEFVRTVTATTGVYNDMHAGGINSGKLEKIQIPPAIALNISVRKLANYFKLAIIKPEKRQKYLYEARHTYKLFIKYKEQYERNPDVTSIRRIELDFLQKGVK